MPHAPLGTPSPPPGRPPDGLLEKPALQKVVDLQVERNGEGLRDLLLDADPGVRARAAFALASVQDPEAGGRLAALLVDEEAGVRADAAFALGQLPDEGYGAVLLRALEEEADPGVRGEILEAVGKVGGEAALLRLLETELGEGEVAAGTLALARMGIRGVVLPGSVGRLVEALRHPDPEARVNAAYYFGRSDDPGPWASRAPEVRAVLDGLPPTDRRAMHLLNGLAKLAAPDDTPRFLQWMRTSPDWRIRTNAAAALAGRTTSREVRNRLVEALEDPSTHVAVSAAGALAASTDMPAREREALKEWVEDHPEKWRRAGPIFTLLGRSGEGEFLRSWLRQWEENRVGPRTRGLSAMAFVPGDEATGVLLDALDSEISRIRSTAMGGLARRWRVEREDPDERERFFDAFVRGLRLRDPGTVAVAAPVLADSLFLPLGSVDVLVEEYRAMDLPEDLEGMQAILEALGRAGSARAETLLEEVMEHPETALRTTAAEALSELRGQEVDAGWGAGEGERAVDWPALAELGPRPRLVLETEKGTVRLVLDAESAPLTVQTVAGFAREGLYDGVPFHRVVPNFVVQGGDFARGDGFGGPGFSIRSEFTRTPYRRGVVGMASAGKDTEGSQYFVTHSMQPHLDGRYTAFGWVEEGMNVVDVLYEEDRVTHARVEPGRT